MRREGWSRVSKALYRHKQSGDIFALEVDGDGKVIASSGPLLSRDLDPEQLDYDNYFSNEIQVKIKDFELVSRAEYMELLHRLGFYSPPVQRHLFDQR